MERFNLRQGVKTTIMLVIVVFGSINVKAQVTIGSADYAPVRGALLELKTQEASTSISSATDAGNITVDVNGGGLGLPRVKLVNRKTLEPFISKDDTEWKSNVNKIKERNAGLMVYNINVSEANEKEADKIFRQGIYTWDGEKWWLLGEKRYFYLPSFNIEIDPNESNTRTCDFYEEYKKQFDKETTGSQFISSNSNIKTISSLENGRVYGPNELEYVVTYYDTSVMTIKNISEEGLMEYTIESFDFSEKTYINVILVVK
jgi:hypothetical protein